MPAPRKNTKAADIAAAVADEIAKQHRDLTIRNWSEIQKVMDAEQEIKLAFSTVLTNRAAEEGTVASKDSRIISTVNYGLGKRSDKIESAFPDPDQMELGQKPNPPADPE